MIYGAPLLYNLMLAEKRQHREWIAGYRRRLEQWADGLEARQDTLTAWDRRAFWKVFSTALIAIPYPIRVFVDAWFDLILDRRQARQIVVAEHAARSLIHDRERKLKRNQARLDNPRALELWNGSAGIGTGQLRYRWPSAQQLLADIHAGLEMTYA